MADVKPLKLVDQGGGAARLSEFEAGDTLPKAVMAALSAADVGAVAADDPRLSDAREWSAETVAQAEAEAGTATTRRAWTAQRVRQAIVAWWNGISSPFGRGLVAAVSPLMGRQHLELGNAATATVQSSNTDSTAGRVLTVGAFGVGDTSSIGILVPGNNIDAITLPAGVSYRFDNTTAGVKPCTNGALIVQRINNSRAMQIAQDYDTDQMFFRRYSGTAWSPWRRLFHQGDILGTVSQSGGIPTGAIIERGSNANGEYVKFADGTMICTLRRSVNLAIDIAFVGGFRSNYESWTYPASFAVASNNSLQGSAPVTAHGLMFQGDGSSGVNIAVLAPASVAAGTRIISASVIGRWY